MTEHTLIDYTAFHVLYKNETPGALHDYFITNLDGKLYCVCRTFEEASLVMDSLYDHEMGILGLD